jgi:signal peptide peptidase SppA
MKAVSPEAEEFLGLCNTDRISQALDEAIENPAVTEIVLKFHSPGGTTNGIEELGRKIKYADSIKPVVAFTDTVCASAAYWLASQARVIGMTPSASIGNVGVYALIEDHSKALEAAGINVQPISAGKFKLMGHPFRPLTDEEKTILQEDTVNHHNKFKAVIKANRQIDDEYLEGLSYEGEAALKYNFVDYVVDSFEEFITTTEEDTI